MLLAPSRRAAARQAALDLRERLLAGLASGARPSAETPALLGPAPLFRLRGRERQVLVVKARERRGAVAAVGEAVAALAAGAATQASASASTSIRSERSAAPLPGVAARPVACYFPSPAAGPRRVGGDRRMSPTQKRRVAAPALLIAALAALVCATDGTRCRLSARFVRREPVCAPPAPGEATCFAFARCPFPRAKPASQACAAGGSRDVEGEAPRRPHADAACAGVYGYRAAEGGDGKRSRS